MADTYQNHKVGPATRAACGTQLANYLAANPATNLQALAAQAGTGYNADKCNLVSTKGYQVSPARSISLYHMQYTDRHSDMSLSGC